MDAVIDDKGVTVDPATIQAERNCRLYFRANDSLGDMPPAVSAKARAGRMGRKATERMGCKVRFPGVPERPGR